ncbi:MAG: glycosyltransferase family 2 protein [Patescibacteria group bacterium]
MSKLDTSDWQVPEYNIFEFRKKGTRYCVGIPIINEGERIKKELQEIKPYSHLADVIIFDGGSTDGSNNKKFLKSQNVRALLVGPMGQARQYRFGFSWALKQGYQGIITIDGNHKDDISAIPKFIEALQEGFDYVQASRFIKGGSHKNTPFYRIFWNRFVISPVLSLAAGRWYTDTPLAFRGYSKKYLIHPKVKPFRNIFERYEHLWYLTIRANQLGFKTKEIPVTRNYPKGEVPTKIVGLRRILDLLNVFKIAFGLYNP